MEKIYKMGLTILTFILILTFSSCSMDNSSSNSTSKSSTVESSKSVGSSIIESSSSIVESSKSSISSITESSSSIVESSKNSISSIIESSSSIIESSSKSESSSIVPTESSSSKIEDNTARTIYLAGDSTVKTYENNQYIGGWGQYLDYFLDDNITVVNCAQGGRSSRSFINEGRLFDISGCNYSFTQNGGKSIGDCITAGDFLFIQFGHNDDDTKMSSSYSTVFDRMVPLGTPDANGIYPTTAGTKVSTTVLPSVYTDNVSSTSSALAEIAKYGDTYYSYDCGGTYKWYLKQYIDFARANGATPVLVTPVARVKFSGDTIIGGAGLHGENFAYVQAVRQLAEEEDCLLIDLFQDTKTMLETATATYANYLMALKPNDLTGTWPSGYDSTYGDAALGYTGIEGTHYNKYGAFLTAAKAAEAILTDTETHNDGKEYYNFASSVNTTPSAYIDPSNLMSKQIALNIEALFKTVSVTNPDRTYKDPSEVVTEIAKLSAYTVTKDNYLEIQTLCETLRNLYLQVNIDDRNSVSNYDLLVTTEAAITKIIEDSRPEPIQVITFSAEDLGLAAGKFATSETSGIFTVVAITGKEVEVKSGNISFSYNGETYSTTSYLSMGGSASFAASRYIEFTTTGACSITVVGKSSGSADRTMTLINASTSATIGSFAANASQSITTLEITEAGTYKFGSAGSGVYVYYVIIEYFE